MRTVAYLLRAQRTWLRSWVSLALLLAVVGGAVLAVGAAARRTDTAYPRFIAASNTSDVFIGGNDILPLGTPEPYFAAMERLPQVQEAGVAYFLVAGMSVPGRQEPLTIDIYQPIGLPDDARYSRTIDTFKVLSGRLPDANRADEVSISFPFADNLHLHVGDRLTVRPWRVDAFSFGEPPADGIINRDMAPFASGAERTVRVTGIIAPPVATDFPPLPPLQKGSVYFTAAFLKANASHLAVFGNLAVKLRHGPADISAFERTAEQAASGQQVNFQTPGQHEVTVQNSIHLEAVGLGLLAGLAALVLLLVLGQGVARRIALDAIDHAALRALGATRPQLFAVAMARAAVTGLAGAVGAVVVAVALSPLAPLGVARNAEPTPGIDLDAAIVLGGAAALAALVVLLAMLPAWRSAGARSEGEVSLGRAGTRLGDLLARTGFPASAVAGVRLAMERGRGRAAVPVRSAIVACALGAATLAGALSFSASLGHLLDSPRLYGWNWDAVVGNSVFADRAARTIAANSWVAADSAGTITDVGVDGERVAGVAMDPAKGSLDPVLVTGREPRAAGEILLGTQTDPGAHVGQTVTVHVGDTAMRLRLVGRGVLPILGDTLHLGVGAWLRFDDLHHLLGEGAHYDTMFVRFAGDHDAAVAKLRSLFGVNGVALPDRPTGLLNFGDFSALPLVLGGVLAAGAIATLAHAVATSVQRRRRDLAILKTLGFVRGQVAATVAWQTTLIAAAAAIVGVPLGVAAGRWAWTLYASQQGTVADPVVPVVSTLVLVPAALLLANLVAAIPGRYAARTSPAMVLRAE
jgi:ABC-type lipoprotein release transport system permease subunit